MASPVYNGACNDRPRGGGYRQRLSLALAPEPIRVGWFDEVGYWLGATVPSYAGQGQPTAAGSQSPVYLPAPSSTASSARQP